MFKQLRQVFNFFKGKPKRKSRPRRKASKPKRAKKIKTRRKPAKPKVRRAKSAKKIKLLKVPKGGRKKVLVGEVTHYFDRAKAGAFMITGAPIAMGDVLEFEGKAGAFRQKVTSLQINRVPVPSARAGDEVGLLVRKPVREGDYVFKINGA